MPLQKVRIHRNCTLPLTYARSYAHTHPHMCYVHLLKGSTKMYGRAQRCTPVQKCMEQKTVGNGRFLRVRMCGCVRACVCVCTELSSVRC